MLRVVPLWAGIAMSWPLAGLASSVQVAANRLGYPMMSLAQLKVPQELITMVVCAGLGEWFKSVSMARNHRLAAMVLGAACGWCLTRP